MVKVRDDLTGKRFGRLIVLKQMELINNTKLILKGVFENELLRDRF